FPEEECVGCCVAHHGARGVEVWRGRSMSPARVSQQRRQSRRIVWDDRAGMRAVVTSELEAIPWVSVNLRMGGVNSIGPRARMGGLISKLQLVLVNLRKGHVSSIGALLRVAASVISNELEAIQWLSVNLIGPVGSIGHSR